MVDAANTMGSRPDGWWRDRRSAVERLRDELSAALARGLDVDPLRRCHHAVLVAEGAGRGATSAPGVDVLDADDSADDAIVALISTSGPHVIVVTADRELRRRVEHLQATVVGPRTLLNLLRA